MNEPHHVIFAVSQASRRPFLGGLGSAAFTGVFLPACGDGSEDPATATAATGTVTCHWHGYWWEHAGIYGGLPGHHRAQVRRHRYRLEAGARAFAGLQRPERHPGAGRNPHHYAVLVR